MTLGMRTPDKISASRSRCSALSGGAASRAASTHACASGDNVPAMLVWLVASALVLPPDDAVAVFFTGNPLGPRAKWLHPSEVTPTMSVDSLVHLRRSNYRRVELMSPAP